MTSREEKTLSRQVKNAWQHLQHWLGWPSSSQRIGEKLLASIGGLVGILIVWHSSRSMLGNDFALLVVPSLGATAVLVFAVPHSPLTQPWAVFGGHVISAIIGITCQRLIENPGLAGACAVGGALFAMHLLRCIHPPGGATALTAVIGGSAVQALGYRYALTPVAINCLLIILLACTYNYAFPWRRYPLALMHTATPMSKVANGFPAITQAQIKAAMAQQRVVLDISPEELGEIFETTLALAAKEKARPAFALRIGGVYGNNRPGPEWSVRRIIDERPSPIAEFDLIVFEIVEGAGRGRIDSCPREAFSGWAGCELQLR